MVSGFGPSVALNILNRVDNLVASQHEAGHTGSSVVKALTVKIPYQVYSDALYGKMDTLRGPISGSWRVTYVGNTSWQSSIDAKLENNGATLCQGDFLSVNWDLDTKQSVNLPSEYRTKAVDYIQGKGVARAKVQTSPPPGDCVAIFSTITMTSKDCMDINGHPHYKEYIFRAFKCLSQALKEGMLAFKNECDFTNMQVKSFDIVFDRDCNIGDALSCTLLKSVDAKTLYVVITKSKSRICFITIRFYDDVCYTSKPKL